MAPDFSLVQKRCSKPRVSSVHSKAIPSLIFCGEPNQTTPPHPTPPQIHNPLEPVSSIPTSNTPIILSQLLSQSFLNPHSHHIPFQILTPFRPQPPRFIEETAISIQKMGSAGYRKRPDGREGCWWPILAVISVEVGFPTWILLVIDQ